VATKWIGAGNMRAVCILCCCQGKVFIAVELMRGGSLREGGVEFGWVEDWLEEKILVSWLVYLMIKCE